MEEDRLCPGWMLRVRRGHRRRDGITGAAEKPSQGYLQVVSFPRGSDLLLRPSAVEINSLLPDRRGKPIGNSLPSPHPFVLCSLINSLLGWARATIERWWIDRGVVRGRGVGELLNRAAIVFPGKLWLNFRGQSWSQRVVLIENFRRKLTRAAFRVSIENFRSELFRRCF